MKRMTAIFIMVLVLTAYTVVPASAWTPPGMIYVNSVEELEELNNSVSGKNYVIQGDIQVNRKIELSFDHSVVIYQNGGVINIEKGGELVIDTPEVKEVYPQGNITFINVKPGGKLVLKRGLIPGSAIRNGVPTVVVEKGGTCELHSVFKIDINEHHTFKDAITGEITRIEDSSVPDIGGGKPSVPETEKQYTGEVVCMDADYQMSLFFTLPELSSDISRIRVERKVSEAFESARIALWKPLYRYEREEDRETPENVVFKHLIQKENPESGEKINIEYFSWNGIKNGQDVSYIRVPETWNEEISGKTVSYRLIYEYIDKTKEEFITEEINIKMPETGDEIPYTSGAEYGDLGGKRSGICQGENERNPLPITPDKNHLPDAKPLTPFLPEKEPGTEVNPEKELGTEVIHDRLEETALMPEITSIVTEVMSQDGFETMIKDEGVVTFHEDETIIYKDTDSTAGAFSGIIIATGSTICIAGGAYAVTRVIKKRKQK